jgi:hypothetical protein
MVSILRHEREEVIVNWRKLCNKKHEICKFGIRYLDH